MKRRLTSGLVTVLFGLSLNLAGAVASEGRLAVGVAASDSVFDVSGSEVTGSTTVFLGEAVTSGQLPTQLQLSEGSRYLVGVGSRVRVGRDKVALDGGSLEILNSSSDTPALHVAGLRLTPRDAQTRAIVYISRPDVLSVSVEQGEMVASRANGEVIEQVMAGKMVTMANTRDKVTIDRRNAAADIAELQVAQLQHMAQLKTLNPTIGSKAGGLLGSLTAASAGLISGSLLSSGGPTPDTLGSRDLGFTASSLASSANYNQTALESATRQVNQGMTDGSWGATGCGVGCRFGVPIVTTHIFFFPVVGGTVRPFCIRTSCLEPPPFRP